MVNVENKEDNVEILISTMNRTSLSFLSKMFPKGDYVNYDILIINQTSKNKLLASNHKNIRIINSFEKGLSRSRNLAIYKAKSNICLLADDDVSYEKGFDKIVVNAFKKHQRADIVTFQMVDGKGRLYNDYPNVVKHNKKTVSTVNSVVIALNRNKIIENNVFFNIHFGLGSTFETADEYIFLRSALKAKLSVCFEPKIILSHPDFSSGKAVASDKIIFARSAVFYKYNGLLTYLKLWWYFLLLLKNKDLKINEVLKKYLVGLQGINKYKSLLKQGVEIQKN